MKIKFHGKTCFSIEDKDFTVVSDPNEGGSLSPNLITISGEHSKSTNGESVVFDWPGEYEVSGIHLKGVASFSNPKEDEEQKENTVFRMEWNGISLCHLGLLGTKLTSEQLEEIGDIDILFIPVGGIIGIDAKKAKEVIEQIEPRVIIPMMYGSEEGPLEPFLAEMGAHGLEALDEFSVKRSELPDDASKVVLVNPS